MMLDYNRTEELKNKTSQQDEYMVKLNKREKIVEA